MFRILKAFAWLRWRTLINALENTGSRDRLERFSIAIERLGPIVAAIVLIPSALGLGGLGLYTGYRLATAADPGIEMRILRTVLFAVPILAVFGPLFLPVADRTNPIRLLLLPIPRTTLYIAQASSGFGDPWTMLMIPLVLGVGVGLAAGGAIGGAIISLLAALLLIVLIIGLAALAASVLHLVVRDRRRGEFFALLFIIIVPLLSMLPSMLDGRERRNGGASRESAIPAWARDAGSRVLAVYPTELFVGGTRAAATGQLSSAGRSVAGLTIAALALHGVGLLAFRKVLESPGTSGARRAGTDRAAWSWALPGLSPGASAVAAAHFRLALRTPRGRSILLMPLAMLALFGVMTYRGGGTMDFGPFQFASGIGLATFLGSLALLSILPIAMNQFAVDRAGLTLALLSPLSESDYLAGKAAGNALIAAPPLLISLTLIALLFPPGPLPYWIALVLGLLATYAIFAPIAAISSAIFPREVDMNSIGRGSNAHSAAGFIGMFAFVGAGLPPLLLCLLAIHGLDRPALAPLLVAGWCLIALLISRALFAAARRTFVTRRENLAMF